MTATAHAAIEKELRDAVVQRRYARIPGLAHEFRLSAEALAAALPSGAERRDLIAGAAEVLEWARLSLCAARAAIADELRTLPFVRRYLVAANPPRAANQLRA